MLVYKLSGSGLESSCSHSYNTVILKLLKSNLNLEFVAGVYAILTNLIYLCKSLPVRYSNIDILYVSSGLKK